MHYFQKKEFVVRMWDKNTEDLSKEEISDESIQRLKDNLLNIDRHLAPYPYEIWQKWKLLTSQITGKYLDLIKWVLCLFTVCANTISHITNIVDF